MLITACQDWVNSPPLPTSHNDGLVLKHIPLAGISDVLCRTPNVTHHYSIVPQQHAVRSLSVLGGTL